MNGNLVPVGRHVPYTVADDAEKMTVRVRSHYGGMEIGRGNESALYHDTVA